MSVDSVVSFKGCLKNCIIKDFGNLPYIQFVTLKDLYFLMCIILCEMCFGVGGREGHLLFIQLRYP
jgi:hypothetical protein